MEKILISACLVGQKVRYDGKASSTDGGIIARWKEEGRLVAICPEVAGGLSVPRPAAEIVGGEGADVLDDRARLITGAGEDVTSAFVDGAHRALALAQSQGIRLAVLKARSPSCGSSTIYDGSFSGQKVAGAGVTAALLRRHEITVYSDQELDQAVRHLAELEIRGQK